MPMKFRVLGAFEVFDDSHEVTPTAPKLRDVLALLALRRHQLVQRFTLLEELWGVNPPPSATSTLHTYIYKLRKILGDDLVPESQGMLRTRPTGYIMFLPPGDLDATVFETLVEEGRAALDAEEYERGAQLLSQALSLWRGPALADVEPGEVLAAHVTSLEESRLSALEMRIDADLKVGRHRETISELAELCAAHPLHEGLHSKLMLALYRSGRRYHALKVYQDLRDTMVEELGLEPSAGTRRLQQSMLESDPDLEAPAVRRQVTLQSKAPFAVPAQLPPDIADFVGRVDIANAIEKRLLPDTPGTAVPIVTLTGMPGVGKSAMVVHAAHLVRHHFSDGQLYADLGGNHGDLVHPSDVLDGFLRAIGVAPDQIPDGCEERSKLFRSCTAGRRILVVLDNAACPDQVFPLLPADSGCGVLVTSRSWLVGLPGSGVMQLGGLSVEEGVQLLANIIGTFRVQQEQAYAERIVMQCGYLPLALRSIGMRLVATQGCPLSKLSRDLEQEGSRLEILNFAGFDLSARLDPSYQSLSNRQRSIFRLLGLLSEDEFTAGRVADLIGCEPFAVDELLVPLVERHLLQVRHSPTGEMYYAFHNFVLLYSRKCLQKALEGAVSTTDQPIFRSIARNDSDRELREHSSTRHGVVAGPAFSGRESDASK